VQTSERKVLRRNERGSSALGKSGKKPPIEGTKQKRHRTKDPLLGGGVRRGRNGAKSLGEANSGFPPMDEVRLDRELVNKMDSPKKRQ